MFPVTKKLAVSSHVYVRHLTSPDGDDNVARLPDPVPGDRRMVPGGWWPPLMLDPVWIRRHAGEFGVFHLRQQAHRANVGREHGPSWASREEPRIERCNEEARRCGQ